LRDFQHLKLLNEKLSLVQKLLKMNLETFSQMMKELNRFLNDLNTSFRIRLAMLSISIHDLGLKLE